MKGKVIRQRVRGKDGAESFVEFAPTSRGKWFWRLVSRNGRIFAVGTERYDTMSETTGWHKNVAKAVRERHCVGQKYRDRAGKWRWRLRYSETNDIVAASHESFSSLWAANKGLSVCLQALAREWVAPRS